MTKPVLNNYTQTLYSLADSYALGPNQFLNIVNDLNKDGMQDSINCYYEENGMKFEVMFSTTVGCGAPGFHTKQTTFKAYDPDRIYYNNLLEQIEYTSSTEGHSNIQWDQVFRACLQS